MADDLASFEAAAASAALSDGGGGGAAPEAVATFEATVAKVQAATTSLATKMLADIDAYAGLGQAGSGAGGAGGAVGAGDVGGVGGAVLVSGANTTREVVARSANLNITVQARAPSQLASEPLAIDRTRVSLPPAVLGKVDGGSAVGLLFFVSRINTHGLGATHGRQRLLSGGGGGGAPTMTMASQLTSFSLRQAGQELEVSELAEPVLLRLPLTEQAVRNDSCIGQPFEVRVGLGLG